MVVHFKHPGECRFGELFYGDVFQVGKNVCMKVEEHNGFNAVNLVFAQFMSFEDSVPVRKVDYDFTVKGEWKANE